MDRLNWNKWLNSKISEETREKLTIYYQVISAFLFVLMLVYFFVISPFIGLNDPYYGWTKYTLNDWLRDIILLIIAVAGIFIVFWLMYKFTINIINITLSLPEKTYIHIFKPILKYFKGKQKS